MVLVLAGTLVGTNTSVGAKSAPVLDAETLISQSDGFPEDQQVIRSHEKGRWICSRLASFLPIGDLVFKDICNWIVDAHAHVAEETQRACLPLPYGRLVCN